MDPISALSVAAATVQFVDFSCNIVGIVVSCLSSDSDLSSPKATLDSLVADANRLKLSNNKLKQSLDQNKLRRPPTETELQVATVAEECIQISQSILDFFQRISPEDSSSSSSTRLKAIRTAFTAVWKKERLDSLKQKLDDAKKQLMLVLFLDLREIILAFTQVPNSGTDVQAEPLAPLENWRPSVDGSGDGELDQHWKSLLEKARNQLRLSGAASDRTIDDPRELIPMPSWTQSEVFNSLFKMFMSNLTFNDIDTRETRIDPAFDKTFQWIFQSPQSSNMPWSSFVEWLSAPQHVYWICGKPASGKSTLMKYIIHNQRTQDLLRVWAQNEGGKQLVTASFYLWNAGSQFQKTQEGMLRSLLYKALKMYRKVASEKSLLLWNAIFMSPHTADHWTYTQLKQAFYRLLADTDCSFCFFIDGLDELEGNLSDLIQLLHRISNYQNVKICVSSRPWKIIEDEFITKPHLLMECLTYPDIIHYINSTLGSSIAFKELCALTGDDRFAGEIVERIAEKSSGVFLWTVLAVRSLMAGLQDGHGPRELKNRLETIPFELDDLFRPVTLIRLGFDHISEDKEIISRSVLEEMLAGLNNDNTNCTDDQSDAVSLESVPSLTNADTFSSVAGFQKVGAAQFVKVFQHDEELLTHIRFACSSKRKADKFNRKFPRLLRVFASDLLEEAGKQEVNVQAKRKSAKIIQRQRDSIAHLLCFEYAADRTTLILENPTFEEQQNIYGGRTASFLEEQSLIKSGEEETNIHLEDIQGSHSDDSDADEDFDETILHIIEDVKQFVMSSEAFNRLKTEFKDFLFPQLRRDIEIDGQAKPVERPQDDDASSKATPSNEDYDRQAENSLPESFLVIGTNRLRGNLVQTLHDLTLGAKSLEQYGKEGVGLFLSQILVYLRGWLRPSVSNGFRRVQWTCSCGRELFSDFDNTDSIAIDEFETQLKMLAPGSEQSSRNSQSNPTTNSSRNNSNVESIGIRGGPDAQGSPCQALRSAMNETDLTSISSHFSSLSVPAYFELCVIAGNHKMKLGEIDITNVKSDGELFKLIWNKYKQLRGAELRAIFVKPSNIHFVRFEVIQHHLAGHHLAGIDAAPMEIPPEDEVKKRQYHYHECPLRTKKPMAHNVFLHYMEHARCKDEQDGNEIAHNKDTFLNRLPKKLQRSIFETQADTALGWGVLIIEGPNMVAMSFAVALAVVVSFLFSIIFAVTARTQEQGFGIGSWLMAVFASGMTAWYYREAERNLIGGI